MEWIQDLLRYVLSVVNNWAGWATGGLVVALIWLRQVISPNWKPSQRFSIGLVALFLLLASFEAWRKEYLKTRPGLHTSLLSIGISPQANPERLAYLITASVSNTGTPTIADGWKLRIKRHDYDDIILNPTVFPPGQPIVVANPNHDGNTYEYAPEDALYLRTSPQPVATGGKVVGLLQFVLTGLTREQVIIPGTIYSLECVDVSGNRIAGEYRWAGKSTHVEYFPGMRPPEVR